MSEHLPECLHDWPDMPVCICDELYAREQQALRLAIAAIEKHQQLWADDTLIRLGLGTAKAAVTKLMREKE